MASVLAFFYAFHSFPGAYIGPSKTFTMKFFFAKIAKGF